jgi:DNA-binding IclR family transcriptional regulator
MAHTYEELHGMTVAALRDLAQGIEHEALHGYSTMHKEQLLPALCTALGIEAHEHHEVVGIDKDAVKARIRTLKAERDRLVEAGDSKQLKRVRRRIRGLKRKIRKATV